MSSSYLNHPPPNSCGCAGLTPCLSCCKQDPCHCAKKIDQLNLSLYKTACDRVASQSEQIAECLKYARCHDIAHNEGMQMQQDYKQYLEDIAK